MNYPKKLRYQKILDISMGEYRVFISVKKQSELLAVGLPLQKCKNKQAWVDKNGQQYYMPIKGVKILLQRALGSTSFMELAATPSIKGLL